MLAETVPELAPHNSPECHEFPSASIPSRSVRKAKVFNKSLLLGFVPSMFFAPTIESRMTGITQLPFWISL
jgi:hypothetical protein